MSLAKLISYKLKIFLARFTRGAARKRYFRLISLVVVGAAFVAFLLGTLTVFEALATLGQQGRFAAGLVVTLAFHALLLLAFVFDIAATTNIFFLSSDLDLLMSSPLEPLKVFALKYLEALGSGSLISVFIAVPVLVAYGVAFGAPPLFFAAAVAILLIFLAVPVSIGTICGMVISRYVPATRVKEILGMVGGLLAVGLWITIQLARPSLVEVERGADLESRVSSVAAVSESLALRLLPSHSAARGIIEMAAGRFRAAALPVLYLVAVSVGLGLLSVVSARRMYAAGWARIAPGGRKAGRKRPSLLTAAAFRGLPPVPRAIVTATTHLFLRDPQQVTPVAMITVMMALLPVLIARRAPGPLLRPSLLLYSLAALSFVGSLNLGVNATVIDGRSFWLIMIAPSSAARKMASKLLVPFAFFVPLVLGLALVFRATGIVGWAFIPGALWLAGSMTAVGSSTGLLLAMSYADWEWEIPKRALRTSGRLLMLAVMAVFFAVVSLLATLSMSGTAGGLPEVSAPVLVLGGTVVAGLYTALMVSLAAGKLDRMEWPF
jgi:hypothetical protein